MASFKANCQSLSWTRGEFWISTDPALFPINQLTEIFDSPAFYWAKSLTPDAFREALDNSLSFGVYEKSQSGTPSDTRLVGIARLVTDFVTFAYLTDVWVDPTLQGKGLGSWLIRCVQEVLDKMPHLRRTMLLTGDWERVPSLITRIGLHFVAGLNSAANSRPDFQIVIFELEDPEIDIQATVAVLGQSSAKFHVLPCVPQLPFKDNRQGVSQPLGKFVERLDLALLLTVTLLVRNTGEDFKRPCIADWLSIEDGPVAWPGGDEKGLQARPELLVSQRLGVRRLSHEIIWKA
ncbi:hypothetical protein HG531_009033 [Fusarium graminearum]|nr:hypothetical protein HG531_009033 [Fusarium graminearum]